MTEDLEKMEIGFLLEAIYRYYGYDFRQYAYSFLQRRIRYRLQAENLASVTGLMEKVLHRPKVMAKLLDDLTINVTEMFREPSFFLTFREKIIPLLRELPFLRFWHAGCATGEEVYSMAILLYEEGLLDKTRIYATDINEDLLSRAREGVFHLDRMQDYTRSYFAAGGKKAFSEYYTVMNTGLVNFHPFLNESVVFANHNLATDKSFNEFHVIICRNVMIYFNKELQNTVHDLFYQSLCPHGFLGLGSREDIRFTPWEQYYEKVNIEEKLFHKIK